MLELLIGQHKLSWFLKELFKCVLQSITEYLQPCAPLPIGEVGRYSELKLMPLTLMPVSFCEATQSKFMQIILLCFCPLLSDLSRHCQSLNYSLQALVLSTPASLFLV